MTTQALNQPSQARAPLAGRATQRLAALLAIGIFAGLSLLVSFSSEGFLEADGCTHYLYARFALREPHFLLNVWGRPLFTALYAVPSQYGGLVAARMLSLLLAIVCALIAMSIARGQKCRWPLLALIFTLAQPLVFLHSFSELTELPFAALIGLAFLAYQRKRWLVMTILASLSPLARPEGFGFVLLACVALVVHRRWWWILLLPIPLLLWNHLGWLQSGRPGPWWSWLISSWPYAGQSLYRSGSVLHYVALLPAVTGPFVFPATCIGIWRSLIARCELDPHLCICRRLIALIPLMILIAHSALYATGKMASSGELRYMLIVAPFWGLLAGAGWEWVFARLSWRFPLRWGAVAAFAGALGNVIYPVLPLRPSDNEDFPQARRFVRWFSDSRLERDFPRVCAAQMYIYFLLDVSPTDSVRALEYRRDLVSSPPANTILVWDPIYSLYNADTRRSITLDELRAFGWIDAPPELQAPIEGWRILLSPSASTTQETPDSPPSP